MKQAPLLAYERVPEFHWKRFRTLNKFGNETYSNPGALQYLVSKEYLAAETT